MALKLRNWILGLVLILVLGACEDPFLGQCIEGDDWGYPKISVSSERSGFEQATNPQASSWVPWRDSKQIIAGANSDPLVIQVSRRDAWTSWYNGKLDAVPPGKICEYRDPLAPQSDFGTSILKGQGFPEDCGATDNPDNYADCMTPCWMKHGYGLYMLAGESDGDLNAVTSHIADLDGDGYLIRDMPNAVGASTGDRLYFKILDTFYDDNEGGYIVRLKSGTRSPKKGPAETIVTAFTDIVDGFSEKLYRALVANEGFINAVRAALTLYIVLYGLSFMLQMKGTTTFGDLVMNTIKVAIVIQVISPGSWEFFYTYLFSFFLDGIQELAALVASPIGNYNDANAWASIDKMIGEFFSGETNLKVASLVFADSLGFLYSFVMWIAFVLFAACVLWIIKLYLLAYVTMAVLIVLAPFFIITMLFSMTKDLFQEWVMQMSAAAIQQLLLFAAVGMFAILIMTYLHRILGYTVCWRTWFDLVIPFSYIGLEDWSIYKFKFYLPTISEDTANLLVQARDGQYAMDLRYVDLPYLDPDYDQDRINAMKNDGDYVNAGDVLLFTAVLFLMYKFLDIVPIITSDLRSPAETSSYESANIFASGERILYKQFGISKTPTQILEEKVFGSTGSDRILSTDRDTSYLGGDAENADDLEQSYVDKQKPAEKKKRELPNTGQNKLVQDADKEEIKKLQGDLSQLMGGENEEKIKKIQDRIRFLEGKGRNKLN